MGPWNSCMGMVFREARKLRTKCVLWDVDYLHWEIIFGYLGGGWIYVNNQECDWVSTIEKLVINDVV